MSIDEYITRFTAAAEFERTHGNLQGCLEFRQLAEWLKELKENKDVLDKIRAEINGMYRVILKGTPKDDCAVRWNDCLDDVLQIIDRYRNEVSR